MGTSSDTLNSGYRILSVDENSPISELPVEPMLDFILYPPPKPSNSTTPDDQWPRFEEWIRTSEGKEVEMWFYNMASQSKWNAKITPRKWSGKGLLGANIHFESYTDAQSNVIKVLSIYVNSPMHKAGLIIHKDYLLGTEQDHFTSIEEFSMFIQAHNKMTFDVWVYNSDTGLARKVALTPDNDWGGSGYLGGDIGMGQLNTIPTRMGKPKELQKKLEAALIKAEKAKAAEENASKKPIDATATPKPPENPLVVSPQPEEKHLSHQPNLASVGEIEPEFKVTKEEKKQSTEPEQSAPVVQPPPPAAPKEVPTAPEGKIAVPVPVPVPAPENLPPAKKGDLSPNSQKKLKFQGDVIL